MDRIPFTLPEDGLREITGYVYFDGEFVVVDARSKMVGLFDEQRQGAKVALSAIAEIRFKRGLFRDRIVIRPYGFELLEVIPGDHERELALRTKRKHRARAEDFVDEVWYHLRNETA